jgi:hypothetical protein
MKDKHLVLILLFFAFPSFGEILKWVDDKGKTHYGEHVPEKYIGKKITKEQSNVIETNTSEGLPYYYRIQGNSLEKNTDRPGGDLRRVQLEKKAKPRQCRNECEKDRRCVAWSFMKSSYNPDDDFTNCYLKWKVAEPIKNKCCLSGTKSKTITNMGQIELNTDRYGADYHSFEVHNNKPLACIEVCSGDPKCKSWTFGLSIPNERPVAVCWLKSAIPSKVKNLSTSSGVKINERM